MILEILATNTSHGGASHSQCIAIAIARHAALALAPLLTCYYASSPHFPRRFPFFVFGLRGVDRPARTATGLA
eukprot:scaffold24919_cov34-Tisochrysis_lutea.AAC.1